STCLASSTFCSAALFTVTLALPVLVAGVLSLSVLVPVAEFTTTPEVVELTVIVTVAIALGASVPRFAVTVPLDPTGGVTSEPCDVVADTKLNEAGKTSVSVTPVALKGVLTFFTVIVYVTFWPAKIGLAEAVFCTARATTSTAGRPLTDALLLPVAGSH